MDQLIMIIQKRDLSIEHLLTRRLPTGQLLTMHIILHNKMQCLIFAPQKFINTI